MAMIPKSDQSLNTSRNYKSRNKWANMDPCNECQYSEHISFIFDMEICFIIDKVKQYEYVKNFCIQEICIIIDKVRKDFSALVQ
jgi:uncharacterized Zn-finger protein